MERRGSSPQQPMQQQPTHQQPMQQQVPSGNLNQECNYNNLLIRSSTVTKK